jgi:hypothetical protein
MSLLDEDITPGLKDLLIGAGWERKEREPQFYELEDSKCKNKKIIYYTYRYEITNHNQFYEACMILHFKGDMFISNRQFIKLKKNLMSVQLRWHQHGSDIGMWNNFWIKSCNEDQIFQIIKDVQNMKKTEYFETHYKTCKYIP